MEKISNCSDLIDMVSAGASRLTLCLTSISTSQQNVISKIKDTRLSKRGKLFRIHLKKPKFCKSKKSAFVSYDNKTRKIEYSFVPCNSWTCPECSPNKALFLKYHFKDIIQLNSLNRFLTLTLDPKKIPSKYFSVFDNGFKQITINKTHEYLTKLLNQFLVNIKRKYVNKTKEPLKYLWVIEFQKNGMAHLHMVINRFLPIKLLRAEWTRIGGGVQINISRVRSLKGISSYIGDYLIKGIKSEDGAVENGGGFKYNERRYSISRSCKKPNKNEVYSLNKLSDEDRESAIKILKLEEVYNTLQSS